MAHQQIANLAVLIALVFALMALAACASERAQAPAQLAAAASEPIPFPVTPEFHGAEIGDDALRSRLPGE